MKINNKKGFSMIETLVVVSMSTIGILTAYKLMDDHYQNEQSKNLAMDINKILKGFDLRFNNDGFEKEKWSNFIGDGYKYENKEQVRDFIHKALIGYNADSCGKLDGWKPVKKDDTENYKDKYNLITCNLWNEKIPFNLNAKMNLNITDDYVNSVSLVLFFNNDKDFKKNFKSLKRALNKARSTQQQGLTGIFDYHFININKNNKISTIECIKEKSNCGLEATYTGSDLSFDYLYTNGNNNMINSKVKFQKDYTGSAIKTCFRYEKDGLSWRKISNVNCGIGYGKKDPSDINSPTLDYIELNTNSLNTNKIFLNKTCSFRDASNNIINAPCGIYLDENSNKVISNYDQVQATKSLINIIDTDTLQTKNATIKTKLDVKGESNLEGTLTVNKKADFNDTVTINGKATDVNLKVLTSAKLNNVTINGDLTSNSKVLIKDSLNVNGDLSLNGVLTTNRIKLSEAIGYSSLGKSCKNIGEGTLLNYQDGSYRDLALCANGKWKLVNAKKDQIIPFNGNCPSGFKKFTQADGRTLMGSGNLYDAATKRNISYSVGQKGGESFHKLTINEMPKHNHKYEDAYFIEYWGNVGNHNMLGNQDPDRDNNLYTRTEYTENSGGDAPHENRMPYYVVNWCIYKG